VLREQFGSKADEEALCLEREITYFVSWRCDEFINPVIRQLLQELPEDSDSYMERFMI